jgi:hypothetical protein
MKSSGLIALLLLAISAANAADEKLYRTTFEVRDRFTTLATIHIEEAQRIAANSVLRVYTDTGGVDYISGIEIMVGFCGVAKSRRETYVQARQIGNPPPC